MHFDDRLDYLIFISYSAVIKQDLILHRSQCNNFYLRTSMRNKQINIIQQDKKATLFLDKKFKMACNID